MAVHLFTLSIGPATAVQLHNTRYPIRQVIIQNITGNGSIYVGDKNMPAGAPPATFGTMVPTASAISLGPFSGDSPLNTTDVYVTGTVANKVHCLVITP
jgi:hypothetical protein